MHLEYFDRSLIYRVTEFLMIHSYMQLLHRETEDFWWIILFFFIKIDQVYHCIVNLTHILKYNSDVAAELAQDIMWPT